MNTPILFYLAPEQWPESLPASYDLNWPAFGEGHYNWSLQTYLLLRDRGFDCELVCDVEDREGIVVAHRDSLQENFKPAKNQLLVCAQADWGRHPYAQVHICQNIAQTRSEGQHLGYRLFWAGSTYFVHHWPQPNLQARSSDRPTELNSLAYFGLDYNLAPELRSDDWTDFLQALGIEWKLIGDTHQWADYSNIDAVLFMRDFSGDPYFNKPATKLQNAWLAKCLPVCTPESAFLEEAASNAESVVYVQSYDELKTKIRFLKDDQDKFANTIAALSVLGDSYTHDVIANEWVRMLNQIRAVDYPKHTSSTLKREIFLGVRWVSTLMLAMVGKLKP